MTGSEEALAAQSLGERLKTRRNLLGVGFAVGMLGLRALVWNATPAYDDSFDEKIAKDFIEGLGGEQFWDEDPNDAVIVPPELQGRTEIKDNRIFGKALLYVDARVRYENGVPLLNWDSAQGGRKANVVEDVMTPGLNIAERNSVNENTALVFTGIDIGNMTFRPLEPETAQKRIIEEDVIGNDGLPTGATQEFEEYVCQYEPGHPEYRGCQQPEDLTADDGLFTQEIVEIIQTSNPGELTKITKKTFDAMVEGTTRCGIDHKLIPQMNEVYAQRGIDFSIDSADVFARVFITALIRDYHARAGVPVQAQVVVPSGEVWSSQPRTLSKAFKQDVQTFFNKFEISEDLSNPAFCLLNEGTNSFSLDIAMSMEQIALGGMPIPIDGWDHVNGVMDFDNPKLVANIELFEQYGISR